MKISVELFGAAREFSTKSHLDFELIENSSIKAVSYTHLTLPTKLEV